MTRSSRTGPTALVSPPGKPSAFSPAKEGGRWMARWSLCSLIVFSPTCPLGARMPGWSGTGVAEMLLLGVPFDPFPTPRRARRDAPTTFVVAGALTAAAAGLALETLGGPFRGFGAGAASAGIHGGFLALGWVLATDARPGWLGPALRLSGMLLAASLASRVSAWGA